MHSTPTSPGWRTKHRYHHGKLQSSALARGREIVALHGPGALTLRGLARDLGVTAPALVYHFGSVAGLRAAVAASVLEQAETSCEVAAPHSARGRTAEELGTAWITFAAANANLYRLACGEGWHQQTEQPRGLLGCTLPMPSPRSRLEALFRVQTRRLGLREGDVERARRLSSSVHGLALARLDGVSEPAVAKAWAHALAS